MFFRATLHHTIQLHPQFLGKGIVDTVIQELEKEVEGENIAGVGCIVAVITVPPGGVSMGRVDALTGFVKFRVTYIAVVFRPLQMEVLDAKVQSVSEFGFFAQLGPIEVFVADAHIPDDMDFISDKMIWRNRETGDELAADSIVRLRVLRAKTDVGRTSAVGTIADACLGVIAAE
ncbi:hypothetical protein FNF27_03828 [Cafeteria roenbergensis]|uniref:S1 motif domain-containing protein n=1 Tax=Cafeteria roenbergensis TaxID=33653 RepID=A0A5A8D5C3_CAFRO|nr:hypothetical protein FNF29_03768 [Cafeteria roenbergensis]KAA0160348.1 hypothetical protein FNF31_04365 [Cafeteria roenbergensis]KAA0161184.1 hypothetical protein FNF28_05133 [Cafeteria roenbergensis]KAA0174705.1 hypothetical protein FNF27_03828 [Cafeteria roenbergensis]|eukprot:KAA0152541.1 hypothetical protein FNF29_03768 [Cafeteria roenbergensis]